MRRTGSKVGALAGAALMVLVGCGSSGPTVATPGDLPDDAPGGSVEPDADAAPLDAPVDGASASADSGSGKDAPEISRSSGEAGGVVVFWPRVIPRTDDPATRELAGKLQKRLAAVVAKAVPKRKQDVRPEPERVCQKVGCDAMTVGVLLTAKDGGCAAVALVSGPGQAPAKLVPWGGAVEFKSPEVPFRDPPENSVTIRDMVSCEKLLDRLEKGDAELVKAITDVAAGS